MSVNNKRVFYVKYLPNEIYVDILRARPDVRLDRLENDSPETLSVTFAGMPRTVKVPGPCRLRDHFNPSIRKVIDPTDDFEFLRSNGLC